MLESAFIFSSTFFSLMLGLNRPYWILMTPTFPATSPTLPADDVRETELSASTAQLTNPSFPKSTDSDRLQTLAFEYASGGHSVPKARHSAAFVAVGLLSVSVGFALSVLT